MLQNAVPKRVIVAWLLACVGCADSSPPQAAVEHAPTADAAATGSEEPCALRSAHADVDVGAGSWRWLVAPHGNGMNGMPLEIATVLDNCESIASFAYDQGSREVPPGPTKLLWSRDGREWEPRELPSAGWLVDMAWGAGTWVAVGRGGEGGVIMSTRAADASGWHNVFEHTESFLRVAFGAGVFVAVVQRGVAVSSDGEHWHWAPIPAIQALYFDVAFGSGRFVVAGVGATLSSSDGETWIEASCPTCPVLQTPPGPAPGAPPQQLDYLALQEIHHAGDAFHAFGASGQLTSSDGITFVPYDGAHVPDAAFGSMLLSVRPSPLLPPPTSKSAFMSSDGGASWSPLPLQADVTSADCKVQYCIATSEGLLAYDPGR